MGKTVPETHLPILENGFNGLLSTIRAKDGLISTNPVAFDWDGEHVRVSTLKERVKYKNLVANPNVTFCVIDPNDLTRYVEIRGHAELIDDPGGSLNKAIYLKMMGEEFDLDPPEAERVIIKIIAQQVSAPLLYGGQLEGIGADNR